MNIDSHGTTEWSAELYRHMESFLYEQNKTLASPVRGHKADLIIIDDPIKDGASLVSKTKPSELFRSPWVRPGFYYVDAYIHLINEIEEVTSKSRHMADNLREIKGEMAPLQKRQYFHFYQRLHSYGGFEWDTNNFGTNPNQ